MVRASYFALLNEAGFVENFPRNCKFGIFYHFYMYMQVMLLSIGLVFFVYARVLTLPAN